ncbi:MAG TPA: PDZ domain-containing protein, partial [Thermoanaerobaculia bacterium]|nr:PDZ domain-containing protein [Thermoanaerobaculia bacterium]
TATWKRYRGGTAPDIWVGHPDRGDFKSVTTFTGTNAFPMWHGGRIFFLSDPGGTANIWSMKPDGSDRKRHTDFAGWDARWPSIGPDGKIVFTLGGDIQLFDPKDGSVRKVDVDLPSDRTLTRVRYPAAAQNLTSFDLSPKGDRLLVTARGKVFSVAAKNGVTLPVTHEDGARATGASYSGDGKKIVYVSDVPHEEEIRTADAWGRGESKVVKPAGGTGWHFPPAFSADGKWIAYADQTQSLYVLPAEGGAAKLVDRSVQSEIREYVFSPDGRWLAYSKALPTDYTSILLYDTRTQKTTAVTSSTTNDGSPAWDPEGRYLYFLSERATNPILDSRDLQNVELKNNVLMAVLLRKDVKNPAANVKGLPGDDDEAKKEDEKDKDKKDKKGDGKEGKEGKDEKKADEPPKPVEIDLDGISSRVVQLPLERGRYRSLYATKKFVFTLSVPLKGMAEGGDDFSEEKPAELTLTSFDLEKRKAKPFLEGVAEFVGARRADKLAVMKKRGEIYVVDAGTPPPAAELGDAKVSLDGVVVEVDPRKEWAQIYYEGWRQMRDFFWDAGMGGVDWKAVRDRYATLLPRLGTRDDLRDLMGELIGELNNSHTYVFGGDPGVRPTRVQTGLLGADVVREGRAFKVSRVYRGDPADNVRSPLDEPGANVAEGEYVVAVNHVPFASDRSFYASFENFAGKEVVLTVSAKASGDSPRDVTVKTLTGDGDLRYADWVRRNREYVAKKTGGKIAYLHLPDMGSNGQTRFNTWFYPQLDKEGMVVDCRWNGGGFVSQMILERFRRKVLTFDRARGGGTNTYPY